MASRHPNHSLHGGIMTVASSFRRATKPFTLWPLPSLQIALEKPLLGRI